MHIRGEHLKRGVLLFWGAWLGIIFLTNLSDLLKSIGLLGPSWRFAGQNLRLITEMIQVYHLPAGMARLLFLGVIIWQGLIAYWFLRACREYRSAGRSPIHVAFGLSLMLWAAFLIAGELFLHYEYEAIHMRLFTAQVLSLLLIHLIPD